MPSDLEKLRKIYELKSVYRMSSVKDRKESSAEHTWSCLILADYFLDKHKGKIDRTKVYELLMYHDLIEIETGDVPIHHEEKRKLKAVQEQKAVNVLRKKIPGSMGKKFHSLFKEFEECKTKEAKFAKAIDKFDATIHELDYKEDWKGWTEEMLRRYSEHHYKEFPEINDLFEEMASYARKNGFFNQK